MKSSRLAAFFASSCLVVACAPAPVEDAAPRLAWREIAPLPQPRANLALTANGRDGQLYAFLGIDDTRAWTGIRREAFSYDPASGAWSLLPPIPGAEGRLA